MIEQNHECYVSLKIAKLLKEAGFDWECETCYIGKSKHAYKYNRYFNWNLPRKDFEKEGSDNLFYAFINQKKTNNFVSTPTLDVTQRWLREVKNLILLIDITPSYCNGKPMGYKFVIHVSCGNHIWGEWKDTYEEAQEAGIKKALEIILEKEE